MKSGSSCNLPNVYFESKLGELSSLSLSVCLSDRGGGRVPPKIDSAIGSEPAGFISCVRMCMYACVHVCMCTRTYVCMHIYVCMCVCMGVYIYFCDWE